jgi:hypothetical protein
MAKQCGLAFLECTWDQLTFYKMEGKYYARVKSSLTREKVLTHPAFHKTRCENALLVAASKIASSIYSDLPIDWRQFWMFRSFTGEAQTMMRQGYNAQEVYDRLWKTYVEYWVIYQHVTGIALKTGRTAKKKKTKLYKTRLRHRGGDDKYSRRYYNLLGKNHWNSSYDHTKDLLEQEEKRKRKELNRACYLRTLEKEKRISLERTLADEALAKKVAEEASLIALQEEAVVLVNSIIAGKAVAPLTLTYITLPMLN